MEDRSSEIFSKYEMKVHRTYRARSGIVLETDCGLRLMSPCRASEKRLEFEDAVKRQIREHGYEKVDQNVRNEENKFVTANSLGERFCIREWFDMEECSLRLEESVIQAAKNLGLLHLAMSGIEAEPGQGFVEDSPLFVLERRNRELKRVQSFLAKRKNKTSFEVMYLNCCGAFYEEALSATEELRELDCCSYLEECVQHGKVLHGAYTYHNILMEGQGGSFEEEQSRSGAGIATVNFDRAVYGMQIRDLYQFLRKVMEKKNWQQDLGDKLMDAYEKVRALSARERRIIHALLAYPEKFWKVTNYYYNSRKSLIPQKNIEKLEMLLSQQKKKELFLKNL